MIRVWCKLCHSTFFADPTIPGPWFCPACSDMPLLDPKPKPKAKPKQKPNPPVKEPAHGTDSPS